MLEHSYLLDPTLFQPKDLEDWRFVKRKILLKAAQARLPFDVRFNTTDEAQQNLWYWLSQKGLMQHGDVAEVSAILKGLLSLREVDSRDLSDSQFNAGQSPLSEDASLFTLGMIETYSLPCVMLLTEQASTEEWNTPWVVEKSRVIPLSPERNISAEALLLLSWRVSLGIDKCGSVLTRIRSLFPGITFSDQFFLDAKKYVAEDGGRLRVLLSHLNVLSEYAVGILSDSTDDSGKAEAFKKVGLEASNENGRVKKSKKDAQWRRVSFRVRPAGVSVETEEKTTEIACNWHTKSRNPQMRLHFAVRKKKLFVGRIADHGPLPKK